MGRLRRNNTFRLHCSLIYLRSDYETHEINHHVYIICAKQREITTQIQAMAPTPLSESRLKQIAQDACTTALSTATTYNHTQTANWNDSIISQLLQTLITETASPSGEAPAYKFMVNGTIIQHTAPGSGLGGAEGVEGASGGRRGMHSAAGAYWNNEKDGMWSYKYEGGEKRGMDVVVMVMWVGL